MSNRIYHVGCGGVLAVAVLGFFGAAGLETYMQSQEKIETIKLEQRKVELEKSKIERGYFLQKKDLNGDDKLEQFFEIEGKKYFVSIDGQNLVDHLSQGRGLEQTLEGK